VAKKQTGLRDTLFREIDPYGRDLGDDEGEQLRRIPVDAVSPDPEQPRRLLPPELAESARRGELSVKEVMRRWLAEEDTPDSKLQELRRLADSIEKQGLINPITVRPLNEGEQIGQGGEYVVVTGERRFWAHVLLALQGRAPATNEEGATLILAREMPEGASVRAHQLIENIMREDINAVEKAKGLVALRKELSKVNYSSLETEVEAEGELPTPKPVPWATVSEVLGISDRYRIYMTSVLNLPKEAQHLVAKHNLAEMTVRPIIQRLKGKPKLQIEALRQVAAWHDESVSEEAPGQPITGAVRELTDHLLAQETVEQSAAERVARAAEAVRRWPEATRFRSKVRGALRYLDQLPEDDAVLLARDLALDANYYSVVEELHQLKEHLDALLGRVSQYQTDDEADNLARE